MTMRTPPSVADSPQVIARSFVDNYYRILNSSPDEVSSFYKDLSILSRRESNGKWVSVTTIQGIKDKIVESMDAETHHWEIETVEAQRSHMNALFVVVEGFVTLMGPTVIHRRRFTQSFFLALLNNYFVLNDVLSFSLFNHRDTTSTNSPVAELTVRQIGRAVVDVYYRSLHTSPDRAYTFYQDSSVLTRREPNNNSVSVTTKQAIKKKIESMDIRKYQWQIETVEAQCSLNGLFAVVEGFITDPALSSRRFHQSFFFACANPTDYFILNDILVLTNLVTERTDRKDTKPAVQTPFVKSWWLPLLTSLGSNSRLLLVKNEKEDTKPEEEEDTNNTTFGMNVPCKSYTLKKIGGSSGIRISHHGGNLRRRGKKAEPCNM